MAHAQNPSLREKLVGAWELVEYVGYLKADPSNKMYPMGKDAKGIIMYTHTGYMSAQIQTPGQAPFSSDDLSGGSDKELIEAAKDYLAYTGPFYLDESGDVPILKHHMNVCTFPNWVGNTQRRIVKMENDGKDVLLTLGPETEMEVEKELRVLRLVWRRLPDN